MLREVAKMKLTKLILIFFFAWCLVTGAWCLVFAVELDVESGGELKTDTFTFNEQAGLPANKAGQVVYSADKAYVSDGTDWNLVGGGRTIATRIVGVDKAPLGTYNAGDSLLTNKTADYICDGADDQAQIQAAIDALGSNGGAVYLLEGTYNISASINMASNVALIGTGSATVLKKSSSSVFAVVYAESVSNILVSQLAIDGARTYGAGVDFVSVTYSKVDKIWVKSLKETGSYYKAGVCLMDSNYNIITNVTITDFNFEPDSTAGNGIELLVGSSYNIVSHNYISQCNRCSLVVGGLSYNNIISDNIITGATSMSGSVYDGSIWVLGDNNIVRNNVVYNNATSGIEIAGKNCTVSGNSVSNNLGTGISLVEYDDHGVLYTPINTVITNNMVSSNTDDGINIYSSDGGNTISGNMLYDNGGSATSYNGIYIREVSGNNDNNLIAGNYIYDTLPAASAGGYGIKIDANSDNNYLTANYIDGAGYLDAAGTYDRRINDLGTNTRYTGKDKITLEQTIYDKNEPDGLGKYKPVSYAVMISTGGGQQIADGKNQGDILILESAANNVQINGANIAKNETLDPGDTLKLIWNGTKWLEIAYADN